MQQMLVQERRATETPEDGPTGNPCPTLWRLSWQEKNIWLFCGLDDEVDRRGKKSEVRSQDECILELAPAPGTIILSLQTSHPFIHFHWVLCRTQNRLFSSIWYQVMGPWERREDHMPRFSPFPPPS